MKKWRIFEIGVVKENITGINFNCDFLKKIYIYQSIDGNFQKMFAMREYDFTVFFIYISGFRINGFDGRKDILHNFHN